jgi:M6 family metalloprotease-like protein
MYFGPVKFLSAFPLLIAGALAASACRLPVERPRIPDDPAQLPEYFGYGVWHTGPSAERSELPVLILLVSFLDREFAAHHTLDFYDQLYFGPGFPNIRSYFLENSQGKFAVSRAGVLGPLLYPDDLNTPGNESILECGTQAECLQNLSRRERTDRAVMIREASRAGFDFGAYDRDNNGVVDSRELAIVLIGPASGPDHTWGNLRPTDPACVPYNDRGHCVQTQVAAISEYGEFATHAHELTHILGAVDIYGPSVYRRLGHNSTYSLMGATMIGGQDARVTFYLDPWHRMNFGWVRPVTHEIGAESRCYWMTPPELGGAPILVFSREYGFRDYHFLEYRPGLGSPGAPNPDAGYDRNLFESGLVVWSVLQTQAGALDSRTVALTNEPELSDFLSDIELPVSSDDQIFDFNMDGQTDTILPGRNRILESTATGGRILDTPTLLVAPPNSVIESESSGRVRHGYARYGYSRSWSPEHGKFALENFDSTEPIVWVRIAETGRHWSSRLAVAVSNSLGEFLPRPDASTEELACWSATAPAQP